MSTVITAEIDREALLNACAAAKVKFEEQRHAAYEIMMAALMEKPVVHTKGWFTPKRTRTREEAEAQYDRMGYLECWSLKGYRDLERAANGISRSTEIENMVQSEKLTSIRLPECDLNLLKNFF